MAGPLHGGLFRGLWVCLIVVGAPAHALSLVRPPYLQVATETGMVVRWRTDVAAESTVRYGPAPDQLSSEVTETDLVTDHAVELTGLQSATRYYYSVGTGDTTLEGATTDHFFVTAPRRGARQPTRIWVIGDSGQCAVSETGCQDASAVRDAYLGFAAGDLADVWLMLGDNAYTSGTDAEHTKAIFDTYPQVLRNTPLWPSVGNHETLSSDATLQTGPYFDAFTLPTAGEAGGEPSGTEAYYAFDWGNIHFVCINSATGGENLTVGGAMYQWLDADLSQNNADWTIIYWHHPPYTKGSHDSDDAGELALFKMREVFVPLIEAHGVDLQLTGHSHSYERSHLIDGHYGTSSECGLGECFLDSGDGDPLGDGAYEKATLGPAANEGTVYSVVGSSSKNGGSLTVHPVMAYALNYEGSLVLDIDGNRLDGHFVDKDGLVGDVFRIVKADACPFCGGSDVTLKGAVFPSGKSCQCSAGSSILTENSVWAQAGASAELHAPRVLLQPGFHAEAGSYVRIGM